MIPRYRPLHGAKVVLAAGGLLIVMGSGAPTKGVARAAAASEATVPAPAPVAVPALPVTWSPGPVPAPMPSPAPSIPDNAPSTADGPPPPVETAPPPPPPPIGPPVSQGLGAAAEPPAILPGARSAPEPAVPPYVDLEAAPANDWTTRVPLSRMRPRFSAALGVGASFDNTGLVDGRTEAVPAFQVQLGAGEDFFGFETRLFATQASGRFHRQSPTTSGVTGTSDLPADRLALDVLLAARPLAFRFGDDAPWFWRATQTLTLNLGFAAENDSVGTPSVRRFGAVAGAHLDFPLSPRSGAGSLRFRLTVRRLFANQAKAGTVTVRDTTGDLFGGLALIF